MTQPFSAFIHPTWRGLPESAIRLRTVSIKRDGGWKNTSLYCGNKNYPFPNRALTLSLSFRIKIRLRKRANSVRTPSDDRHFHVSAIAETWKRPRSFDCADWNVLDGAKRLNDWNAWNGLIPRGERSEAVEPFDRTQGRLLERLELATAFYLPLEQLELWNSWNRR